MSAANRNVFLLCVVFLPFAGVRAARAAEPASLADGMQGLPAEQAGLSAGRQAFQEQRWLDAMADFVAVLQQDPGNAQAHSYVALTIREIEAHHHAAVQEARLRLLNAASKRLEDNWQDPVKIENAISDTTQAEERARRERRQAWCEEAKVERQLGHLPAANALVLRVIAEDPSHREAQQELSELQSAIHRVLETGSDLSVSERYALQGFYAYGQADYAAAADAWGKARALIRQTVPSVEAAKQLAALHFEAYAQRAQDEVDQAKRREEIRMRFARGTDLYQKGRYGQALETFRQVALADPEYPPLAFYLVQAEAKAEQERTRLLSEQKRREIALAFEKGLRCLEHEQYIEAEQAFRRTLALDPSHPQAGSYLTVAQAEIQRRHDPRAAEQHYEAGLIAYAGGKLEEALREWNIATRMNPQHQKALNALAKVQKELAFSKEGG